MKTHFKITLLLLITAIQVNSQERSNIYTNLLNPFIYNPALAGSTDNILAIVNTRGVAGGIDGSSRSFNFGIHAPMRNTMGIGMKVLSSSFGAFHTICSEGVYSKFVKLNTRNLLKLGLSLGITQTNLKPELLNKMVDLSDPALDSKDLNRVLILSGIGMSYKFDNKAELGLSFPGLMVGDRPLNDMMIVNASWNFIRGTEKEWKIKPIINFYKLNSSPNMTDALIQGSWKEMVSLMGGYRSNGSLIISAGLNFKTFGVNYAYYKQISGMMALAPVQNELAITFGFNKPQPSKNKNITVSDEVIQDEIDKLNDRLNGLVNIDKTNPGLVNMKKEINKLNKDLEKILSRYKIVNNDQIQKIKNLQSTLESLIIKYND
ncbi:MAG: PorP/SprF family type IX secretion system membrane protein [Bacteroidota bacterium]|nr:PorP/SprF family type IX secretion system membrane protein [Bacteroidota bacterium]